MTFDYDAGCYILNERKLTPAEHIAELVKQRDERDEHAAEHRCAECGHRYASYFWAGKYVCDGCMPTCEVCMEPALSGGEGGCAKHEVEFWEAA